MPPYFFRMDGNKIVANRVQKELFKCWKELVKEWSRPDVLVLNGDIIDGIQASNAGVEVWTADLDEQLDAATQLIEMIKPRKTYVVAGTNYHVSTKGRKQERTLAANFGSKLYVDLPLDFEGHKMHFAHHIGRSAVFHYRTTPLAREMLIAKLNEHKTHRFEWLVRSHVHYFVQIRYGTHGAMTLPGWETPSPYAKKFSAMDIADIGGVRFIHTPNKKLLDFELKEWAPPRPPLVVA